MQTIKEVKKEISSAHGAVLYKIEDGIATITLNRPEKFNTINHYLLSGILEGLTNARADDEVKVVVLTGNGRGFSAGADISGPTSEEDIRTPLETRDYLSSTYAMVIRKIMDLEKPVLAAINGTVSGASIGIALSCDFKIMKSSAKLRVPFIDIALVPDNGTSWLIARAVGYTKAMELMILGEKKSAQDCLDLGLITKVVDEEDFDAEVLKFAKLLASKAPIAYGMTKKLALYAMDHGLYDHMAKEAEFQSKVLGSEDNIEGITAFFEKRSPNFKG